MLRSTRTCSPSIALSISAGRSTSLRPRVGDEGTDEELEKIFQPIRNRVRVTEQKVTISSGLTGVPSDLMDHD